MSVLLTCCQPPQMLTAVMARDQCTKPLHWCKTIDHEVVLPKQSLLGDSMQSLLEWTHLERT